MLLDTVSKVVKFVMNIHYSGCENRKCISIRERNSAKIYKLGEWS